MLKPSCVRATLCDKLAVNRPYLLVMKNGKEHSIFLEEITDDAEEGKWLVGKVSIGMTLTLSGSGGDRLTLNIDRDNEVEQRLGEATIVVIKQCIISSETQNVYISLGDVSVIEDSSRPLVSLNEDKALDEEASVEVFPELARYRSIEGGFSMSAYNNGPSPLHLHPAPKVETSKK